MMKIDDLISTMLPQEAEARLESLQNINRDDFYTDGKLDLAKAKRRGKLHQVRTIICDTGGYIVDIELHNDRSGFVYLVLSENGLVKIGRTHNLERRFSALRAMSPVELELIASKFVNDAKEFEQNLHQVFDSKNVRGEWFDLAVADLKRAKAMLAEAQYS